MSTSAILDTQLKVGTRGSFADVAPAAFGGFSDRWETLEDVRQNGWIEQALLAKCDYPKTNGEVPNPTYNEDSNFTAVHLRRRPCDGYSLQSENFRRFEETTPRYFRYPYSYPQRGLSASAGLETILALAREELGALDYLQPLASVIQAVRRDRRSPFIARCWDFGGKPGALIKKSSLAIVGEPADVLDGACICYQPPTPEQLEQNRFNYLIFRNVVGHEIGHYCWSSGLCKSMVDTDVLAEIERSDVEQVVSLFSIFLIMYRGYWERELLTRDELGLAFEKLGFETTWAANHEAHILDAIEELQRSSPRRTFLPGDINATEFANDWGPDLDPSQLSERVIFGIRSAARNLAERSNAMPFASSAGVTMLRKIDNFITYQDSDPGDTPRWVATDRSAEHLEVLGVRSDWREYRIFVPRTKGEDLPLGPYLEVARHLAHIRLHGGRFGESLDLMQSQDIERVCDKDGRDLARALALALYAHDGKKTKRRFSKDVAKLLLHHDPSNLRYLVPHLERHFQWCYEDPDCPDAKDRFLAEIHEVGRDEAHLIFWGDSGARYRASIPLSTFKERGFRVANLRPFTRLKLFGVVESGIGRLIPTRID